MFEKLWKIKMDVMMRSEKEHDFPEFIKLLRNLMGVTRRSMACDTGITPAKLLDLEHGHFLVMPKENTLKTIADYFGIPVPFLEKKCQKYCSKAEKKKFATFNEMHPDGK